MQRPNAFVLFPPPEASRPWQVGTCGADDAFMREVPGSAAQPSGDIPGAQWDLAIAAVAAFLNDRGYRGQPVVLALPSRWCLAATLPTADLPRRRGSGRRRALLLFRLEEYLPVATESLAADFAEPNEGTGEGDALGVAVDTAVVGRVLDALGEVGVAIDHACPAVLLAAQTTHDDAGPGSQRVLALGGPGNEVDVVVVRHGAPTRWALVRPDPAHDGAAGSAPLASHLRHVWQDGGPEASWLAVGAGTAVAHPGIQWTFRDAEPTDALVLRAAVSIVSGQREPWIDLLRGASGGEGGLPRPDRWRPVRRPLRAAAAGGLALLGCIAGALAVRTQAYAHREAELLARQAEVCRQAIGRPPPPGLTARERLASEARRLAATSGVGSATGPGGYDAAMPSEVPILTTLADVLAALPAVPGGDAVAGGGPRYRLLELQLAPDRLLVEGESRAHGDAESLATSLRRSLGEWYAVDAPRTQARSQGAALPGQVGEVVGFTISGQPVPPASPIRPAAPSPAPTRQAGLTGGG